MRSLVYLLWLGVAVAAHVLVALFGVFSRWLQLRPTPPVPALRLIFLVTLLALAVLLAGGAARAAVDLLLLRRRRRRDEKLPPEGRLHQGGAAGGGHHNNSSNGDHGGEEGKTAARAESAVGISADASSSEQTATACPPTPLPALPHLQPQDSVYALQPGGPLPPPRPDLAVSRGLSRRVRDYGERKPRAVRAAALATLTATFAIACGSQISAPGFVDASLVQLVNMFTVCGVALFQALLLKHRLPWQLWPCAGVMLGGSAMVIVPTFGNQDAGAGGIQGRGWIGFGLSISSMVATVFYFVTLQATRRLGFTSLQLQYCFLLSTSVVLLPLTLCIDGTDWSAQFDTWSSGDWVMLLATSTLVYTSANFSIQHATWRLGAPTVSMFYGLRLVAAIVESKIVLGVTVITTGLQIAGVAITVSAVTAYMIPQFLQSRKEEKQKLEERQQAADAREGRLGAA